MYLSKSKKAFKPKAPVRREPTPASSEQAPETPGEVTTTASQTPKLSARRSSLVADSVALATEATVHAGPEDISTRPPVVNAPAGDDRSIAQDKSTANTELPVIDSTLGRHFPPASNTDLLEAPVTAPQQLGEAGFQATQKSLSNASSDQLEEFNASETRIPAEIHHDTVTEAVQGANEANVLAAGAQPSIILQDVTSPNSSEAGEPIPSTEISQAPTYDTTQSTALQDSSSPLQPLNNDNGELLGLPLIATESLRQSPRLVAPIAQLATNPSTQASAGQSEATIAERDGPTEPPLKKQKNNKEGKRPGAKDSNRDNQGANSGLGLDGEGLAPASPKAQQKTKKRRLAQAGEENTAGKARAKKRKPAETANDRSSNQAEQEGGGALEDRGNRKKSRGGGRKRRTTPENAQSLLIAPNEVRMSDLCVDSHEGKVSSREERLKDRDRDQEERRALAAQEAARRELQDFMENPDGTSRPAQQDEQNQNSPQAQPPPESSSSVPRKKARSRQVAQTKVVDGRIVIVENSHIIDRHNQEENPGLEFDENASVTVEDDLSKRVNNATYLEPKTKFRWNPQLTEEFYEGIRYFGMDFTIMQTLFPSLTRLQLKKKFQKEQKADPHFINQVLQERKPAPTAEELQKISGKVLLDPKEVYKDLEVEKEQLLEDQRREEEAQEEARKEREKEVEDEGARLGAIITTRDSSEGAEDESVSDEQAQGNQNSDIFPQASAVKKAGRQRRKRNASKDDEGSDRNSDEDTQLPKKKSSKSRRQNKGKPQRKNASSKDSQVHPSKGSNESSHHNGAAEEDVQIISDDNFSENDATDQSNEFAEGNRRESGAEDVDNEYQEEEWEGDEVE